MKDPVLKKALTEYFISSCKPCHDGKTGVELEHFVTERKTGRPVGFAGPGGVEELLGELIKATPGAAPFTDPGSGCILGYEASGYIITLEPAAQLEISISAQREISELGRIYRGFRETADGILSEMGLDLMTVGCLPHGRVRELSLIPKKRYQFMDNYFRLTGDGGMEMMRGTASTQVSVDYSCEEDFRRKFQAACLLTPVFQLLCDNSPVYQDIPLTHPLKRNDIWRRTDDARCGIVPGAFSSTFGFEDYADYLCRVPLILRQKGDETEYVGEMTAEEAYAGRELTTEDLLHVMSMVFPDVRVKGYLELRGADALPEDRMLSYCRLVKGIMYSGEGLDLCRSLITKNRLTEKDVYEAQDSLEKYGWDCGIYGMDAGALRDEVLRIAGESRGQTPDVSSRSWDEIPGAAGECFKVQDTGRAIEREIFREYVDLIKKDPEENEKGALALKDSMERSPLYFRGRCTAKTLQIPKVYSKITTDRFREIGDTAFRIFTKVIREYCENEAYRNLFEFPDELRELILSKHLCPSPLPMARFDIFYHQDTGDYYFCEINTDGTSAMNEDRLLGELMVENPAHQEIIRKYELRQFELFDSWVRCFLRLYRKYSGSGRLPDVAIVDFSEGATTREFQEFQRRFQKAGVSCEICDPRDMTYRDGKLYSGKGHRIDAIYRRAVTSDVLKHMDEVRPFLQAVKDGKIFMAGDFRTQVIHNKRLFHILRRNETREILTPEENAFVEAHIPVTVPFTKEFVSMEEVLKNKDRYILKPWDSYASNGVWAGVEFGGGEWESRVSEVYGGDYLCQDYCPQYFTENIDYAWGDGVFKKYINMAGLYMYDGVFSGVYSRMAEGSGIIASHRNERTVPTFVV